jgi:hypothetical protein
MIHIITACSRPGNLPRIKASIPKECSWTVCLDASVEEDVTIDGVKVIKSPYTGNSGNMVKNYALNKSNFDNNDWVYFLDDDNIIHPAWHMEVTQHLNKASMLTWGQLTKNNKIRLRPVKVPRVKEIDTASYMIKWSVLKHLRFHETIYEADGLMAEQVYAKHGCYTIPKYICYYNFLR